MLIGKWSSDGSRADVAAGQVRAIVVMGVIIRRVLTLTVAGVPLELLLTQKQ